MRAQVYFEHAKSTWELEDEYMLPNGMGSWVVVARQGSSE